MAQIFQDFEAFDLDAPADTLPIFTDPDNQYAVKQGSSGSFAGKVIRRIVDNNDPDHVLLYDEQGIDLAQPFEVQFTFAPTSGSGSWQSRFFLGYNGTGPGQDNSKLHVIWDDGFSGCRLFIDGSVVSGDSSNEVLRGEPNRLWITYDGTNYNVYTETGADLALGDEKPATPALSHESAPLTGATDTVSFILSNGSADFHNIGIGTDGDAALTEGLDVFVSIFDGQDKFLRLYEEDWRSGVVGPKKVKIDRIEPQVLLDILDYSDPDYAQSTVDDARNYLAKFNIERPFYTTTRATIFYRQTTHYIDDDNFVRITRRGGSSDEVQVNVSVDGELSDLLIETVRIFQSWYRNEVFWIEEKMVFNAGFGQWFEVEVPSQFLGHECFGLESGGQGLDVEGWSLGRVSPVAEESVQGMSRLGSTQVATIEPWWLSGAAITSKEIGSTRWQVACWSRPGNLFTYAVRSRPVGGAWGAWDTYETNFQAPSDDSHYEPTVGILEDNHIAFSQGAWNDPHDIKITNEAIDDPAFTGDFFQRTISGQFSYPSIIRAADGTSFLYSRSFSSEGWRMWEYSPGTQDFDLLFGGDFVRQTEVSHMYISGDAEWDSLGRLHFFISPRSAFEGRYHIMWDRPNDEWKEMDGTVHTPPINIENLTLLASPGTDDAHLQSGVYNDNPFLVHRIRDGNELGLRVLKWTGSAWDVEDIFTDGKWSRLHQFKIGNEVWHTTQTDLPIRYTYALKTSDFDSYTMDRIFPELRGEVAYKSDRWLYAETGDANIVVRQQLGFAANESGVFIWEPEP